MCSNAINTTTSVYTKSKDSENVAFERLNANKYGLKQDILLDKNILWIDEMIIIMLFIYFREILTFGLYKAL